ncbi:MAG: allantoinase PuuE [Pseudomonadota bacterium]
MPPPRYPRDMIGYGATPPNPHWPSVDGSGEAKIAIQIVLNYEEGGENATIHGDAGSEAFLSEIVGAASWPGQRHWNMESIYEYGARAGFWRLHRLFTGMGIPLTVYGVATALARSPEQVEAMKAAQWEIASHGLKWIEYKDYSRKDERKHMEEAIRLHTEVVGERPRGWYTGRTSMQTVSLAAEEGGFAYVADSYADDLPYWHHVDGRHQLIVPYTLDANDMRFATPQGFNSGDQFFAYLTDSFDALYAEGEAGSPKMMSVGLHCRLAGRPGRIMALKRFLEHAAGHEGVWFARRIDIAKHWSSRFPPSLRSFGTTDAPSASPPLLRSSDMSEGTTVQAGGPASERSFQWNGATKPSKMKKEEFVELFGSVFEHSPWVAKHAYKMELGPAHDTPAGLHNALVRAFRSASQEERLSVLQAHPDLAGKLAEAERLTDASTEEQASAGLDALTDEERSTFERLNESYTERFGFPFIIAVKDHTKAGILEAFERRLENERVDEFDEACRQVERIARIRLDAMLGAA